MAKACDSLSETRGKVRAWGQGGWDHSTAFLSLFVNEVYGKSTLWNLFLYWLSVEFVCEIFRGNLKRVINLGLISGALSAYISVPVPVVAGPTSPQLTKPDIQGHFWPPSLASHTSVPAPSHHDLWTLSPKCFPNSCPSLQPSSRHSNSSSDLLTDVSVLHP